jgi:8-oxo-dGTP diphosphatase
MPERPAHAATRKASRRASLSVDVALLTPLGGGLTTLLVRADDPRARERWELPRDAPKDGETLDEAAARIARGALGMAPSLIEQVGAFGDRRRHPSGAAVSVAFFGLVPAGAPSPVGGGATWFALDEVPAVAPRVRAMLDATLDAVRSRLDHEPLAFRLLPAAFTLSQLQEVYEILLGRRLHKASFRRALHAAWLVEPTDEWRSEGRGRPAQLFRYAPRRRRGGRRGVRFDGLSG